VAAWGATYDVEAGVPVLGCVVGADEGGCHGGGGIGGLPMRFAWWCKCWIAVMRSDGMAGKRGLSSVRFRDATELLKTIS
jgi:hypothetical protein